MLVIRRKISLDFVGEEYKDSYLIMKALPLNKYEEYLDKSKKLEEEAKEQPLKAVYFLLDVLKEHFIEGKIFNDGKLEDIQADDFGDLDFAIVQEIFNRVTGVTPNPK